MKLNGKRHFEIPRKRIPKGAVPGRCQGTRSHGKDAECLTVSDSTCKMFDTALAWRCLQDAVLLVPDKSGIFWDWAFCKIFIAECSKAGGTATVDRMVDVIVRVSVRGQEVYMTVLDLWKELEPSWRQQVSNAMATISWVQFWTYLHANTCCLRGVIGLCQILWQCLQLSMTLSCTLPKPFLHHMQLLNWSNYVRTNGPSWPALGLEAVPNIKQHRAAGVYTHEGHSMTLLRQAIKQWSSEGQYGFQAYHIPHVTNGYHLAPADQVTCCTACWMRRLCMKVCTPASCAKTTACGLLTAVHPSLNCLNTTSIPTNDA